MGSSRPTESLLNMHRTIGFTGYPFGTVEISLKHSCRPTINRQGITLPVPRRSHHLANQMTTFKTVRVTAAVYRGFNQLDLALTHRHWTGLRSYTNRFQLAAPYVFVKQSDLSCDCDLPCLVYTRGAGMACTEDTPLFCRIP